MHPKNNAASPLRKKRSAGLGERLLLVAGLLLLAIFLAAHIHRILSVRSSMKDFEAARQELAEQPPAETAAAPEPSAEPAAPGGAAEMPGWPARAPRPAAVSRASAAPLAILRIPSIHLEVPVLRGTDEISLNRGVGHIAGTAAPGEKGNIGVAGHRDSFFRDLRNLNKGDAIELESISGPQTYIVDLVLVTDAADLSVLRPRDTQSLTLVTCYPFTYIGPAPRRFVVQASLR